ncbi:MAG: RtcB family protein [Candidatus Tectomicrobia bacterium]|nr:RtcB family protein [Candidatus Tectomicrobia bacterium]
MELIQLDPYRWEVPQDHERGMRVPARIYADDRLMAAIRNDQSLVQVVNGATLPGIVGASLAMPDMHFGYGLPIGGVVAMDPDTGVISPGGTGYDINCGVRLLRSNLVEQDVRPRLKTLVEELFRRIPTGVGSRGKLKLSPADERAVTLRGARWAVQQGYGSEADLACIEAGGCLEGADPDKVSSKAFERGRSQVGTLGSGNHFLEVQIVDEVFDEHIANVFGLFAGQIAVLIHTGSRGFGHQVCTDYLVVMERCMERYGIQLPDRQLACAPFRSPEGQDYLAAMRCAANFAFANRQCITAWARQVFEQVLGMGPRDLGLALVYDVAHNIVKIEEHLVNGTRRQLVVHRKGATRAFPPGHPEVPPQYRAVGQPTLIPGDMGRASYVLAGTQRAMEETFGSTCHGAGRALSRHAAKRLAKGHAIQRELEDRGIIVRYTGRATLMEEIPEAYKDVTDVVNVVHAAGISRKVARLRPIGVIKG